MVKHRINSVYTGATPSASVSSLSLFAATPSQVVSFLLPRPHAQLPPTCYHTLFTQRPFTSTLHILLRPTHSHRESTSPTTTIQRANSSSHSRPVDHPRVCVVVGVLYVNLYKKVLSQTRLHLRCWLSLCSTSSSIFPLSLYPPEDSSELCIRVHATSSIVILLYLLLFPSALSPFHLITSSSYLFIVFLLLKFCCCCCCWWCWVSS